MGEKPYKNDGHDLTERTCRIIIKVKVRVREIIPESVADYFAPGESEQDLSWEWAERQNRLLLALLKDEESLNQFLILITRDELEMLTNNINAQHRSDDELFEKVYSTMGSADTLYFQEAKDEGLLSDNLELLDKAFVINWNEALIEDVRVIDRDDT